LKHSTYVVFLGFGLRIIIQANIAKSILTLLEANSSHVWW